MIDPRWIQLEEPISKIMLDNWEWAHPVASLRHVCSDVMCHIIVDDGCYVLLRQLDEGLFATSTHWHADAVVAVRAMPDLE